MVILTSREVVNTNAPELSWFHGLNSSSDSEGEVGIEITARVDETMKHPGGVSRRLNETRATRP